MPVARGAERVSDLSRLEKGAFSVAVWLGLPRPDCLALRRDSLCVGENL